MFEPQTRKQTLHGVPISTVVTPLIADASRFLARSSTVLGDKPSGKQFFFSGASVSVTPEEAARVSGFEVIERLLAMPVLYPRRTSFPAFDYQGDRAVGEVAGGDILLAGKTPLNQNETSSRTPTRGAVGLGLGTTLRAAKTHGLFEVVERHLRTTLWYREQKLRGVGRAATGPLGFEFRRYAAEGAAAPIPFCLSVITASGGAEPVFFCGSAVRERFADAAAKADDEALTLLDHYLAKRSGPAGTEDTRVRFLGLRGRRALEVAAQFRTRIVENANHEAPADLTESDLLALLGVHGTHVKYARIVNKADLQLVRVLADNMTCERMERARGHRCIADPFC